MEEVMQKVSSIHYPTGMIRIRYPLPYWNDTYQFSTALLE